MKVSGKESFPSITAPEIYLTASHSPCIVNKEYRSLTRYKVQRKLTHFLKVFFGVLIAAVLNPHLRIVVLLCLAIGSVAGSFIPLRFLMTMNLSFIFAVGSALCLAETPENENLIPKMFLLTTLMTLITVGSLLATAVRLLL